MDEYAYLAATNNSVHCIIRDKKVPETRFCNPVYTREQSMVGCYEVLVPGMVGHRHLIVTYDVFL